MAKLLITLPVGRLVGGSLYDPSTTDMQGNQLVVKTGPSAGKPRVDYWVKVAIPKNPGETHFSQARSVRSDGSVNDWGAKIWAVGNQAFPAFAQHPIFSWKIEDGDDATPNPLRKGRRNCDAEGFAGHWIVRVASGFAPKIYRAADGGYTQVLEKDFCKPGYYVEMQVTVEGNNNDTKPGIYINGGLVCFRAFGEEIEFGPDVASAGFGASPLPAGASMTPPASAMPMPAYAPPAAPPAAPAYGPPAPSYAIPVTPVPTFAQVPAANPHLPGVASAPAVPGLSQTVGPAVAQPATISHSRQMTAAAGGASYEALIQAGWNDVLLIQHGMMLA